MNWEGPTQSPGDSHLGLNVQSIVTPITGGWNVTTHKTLDGAIVEHNVTTKNIRGCVRRRRDVTTAKTRA